MRKARVLFICVENSCRSQMAEGFANALGPDFLEAHSAGSMPSGRVDKTAVLLMKEKGVDISKHRSKGLNALPAGPWDYVVTMGCGDSCPVVPAKDRQDWSLPDPKGLPLDQYRQVRDAIEMRVKRFLEETLRVPAQKR